MPSLARIPATRPERYVPASYAAFRVAHGLPVERATYPIAFPEQPADLADALALAQRQCGHKDRLLIRETDERGTRLHIYAIRKGAAMWTGLGIEARRLEPLKADVLCVVDLGAVG